MACYQNLLGIFPNFFDFQLHCVAKPTYAVQLVVEAAGVTNWFSVAVPPPERRLSGLAISAHRPLSPRGALGR